MSRACVLALAFSALMSSHRPIPGAGHAFPFAHSHSHIDHACSEASALSSEPGRKDELSSTPPTGRPGESHSPSLLRLRAACFQTFQAGRRSGRSLSQWRRSVFFFGTWITIF